MNFEVIWTKEADTTLGEIILHLEKEWYQKQIFNFLDRIEKLIELIKVYPYLFPVSKTKGLRKAVINKQSSLFYKVDQDKIIIISVRSNAKGQKNYPS
ncbi:type II toxin-antitoxin system RelE/ParE family toxin [Aquiflexum lacus]|uniref:type II toxin-antitoxin system RelE/ParE family toxin n=1 Tax=Aquiflexum lacus TaxID=2483805 RepID=UPI001894EED1|nr:type II toxin-antitoxin system RelE/ParE family toxin [Aquiflexum lacus]